jgi:hypothetical protein
MLDTVATPIGTSVGWRPIVNHSPFANGRFSTENTRLPYAPNVVVVVRATAVVLVVLA